MKISKRDIAAIGTLVGKDHLKPGKPRTTHLTKELKTKLFEATYQLYKQLEAKKNLKRPGRQYEVGSPVQSNPAQVGGMDLHCPNCGENLGKATENPKGVTCGVCGHKFCNRYGEDNDGYTPAGMPLGKCPVQANPSWVADHDIWMAAKAKAPGAPWGVITNLYKQMGGRIFSKEDFASKKVQDTKRKNWKNKMKTAGVF